MPGLRNPVFRLPVYNRVPQNFLYLKYGFQRAGTYGK